MPAGTRRRHEKSHHGCAQCKRRRVKCDFGRPICKNCVKYGGICEYNFQRPLAQSAEQSHSPTDSESIRYPPDSAFVDESNACADSSSTHGTPGVSAPSPSTDPAIHTDHSYFTPTSLLDLELMHHYTSSTWTTLSEHKTFSTLWQQVVPREALNHPFLMHGILALSALHLAQIDSGTLTRSTYVASAMRHQDTALALFRRTLSNINRANCSALFAFSSFVAVFAFEYPQLPGRDVERKHAVEEILEIIVLLRGVAAVIEEASEWVQDGSMGPMLRSRREDIDAVERMAPAAEEDENVALNRILARIEMTMDTFCGVTEEESRKSAAYRNSIHNLRSTFGKLKVRPGDRGMALLWPITVGADYISLLKAMEPMALVILAHFGVLLHGIDGFWWSKGWGKRVVEDVARNLDDEWTELMRWPLKKVGIGI